MKHVFKCMHWYFSVRMCDVCLTGWTKERETQWFVVIVLKAASDPDKAEGANTLLLFGFYD